MGAEGTGEVAGDGEEEKMIRKLFLLIAYSLLLTAFLGCGYTTRSLIAEQFKTIHIAQFTNKIEITSESGTANKYKIYRPALETELTQAVIDGFLSDGNLRPAKDENADLILKGELLAFERDPLKYTDSDEVQEYRINLVVNISLWDNRAGKSLWEEKNFTGDATYFTQGRAARSEDSAVSEAVVDLARRIVERAVEEW